MANPLQWLGFGRKHQGFTDPFTSPWQTGNLSEIVYSDIFPNADFLPMTRAEAIGVPAVSKGRNLVVSTGAKFPLRALSHDQAGTDEDTTSKYPWMFRTNGAVSPYTRMAWTLDDAIFYGASVWDVVRGSAGADGRKPILEATWRPTAWWRIARDDNRIEVTDDGGISWRTPDEEEIIFFDFPFEGLLNIAQRTLRGARDQEVAWTGRAMNPIPMIELSVTDDSNLTPAEVQEFVAAWGKNRTAKFGSIGYTPPGLEIKTHGEVKADLMTEGRNAVRTDLGSFLNIPTVMMDGSLSEASLTYSTTEGNRNRFHDESMPFWLDPIAARLSQDDVMPRGSRVRFDYSEVLNPVPLNTGAVQED